MNELGKRLTVSAIFIPVLLIALYTEGIPLFSIFFLLSALGAMEFRQMMLAAGHSIPFYWLFWVPLLFIAWLLFPEHDLGILWLAILPALLHALIIWEPHSSLPGAFANIFGILYTALFPALILRIAWYYPVKHILLALILMIWIVDSMAYFVGMRFGKKREITPVSPKKSREGFIAGGLTPFIIIALLYAFGFSLIPWREMLLVGIAAGIFGQLGDLVESMLKRYSGVKDSSRIIPGHGGILDRMDSVLFAGSFLSIALAVLQKLA